MYIPWYAAWLLVVAAAIAQFALITWKLWENRRFARSRLLRPLARCHEPRVALIAPCKGLDPEIVDNLRPLFRQQYANYQLVFVVESADDPVCGTLRRLMMQYPRVPATLLVSGPATDTGQKVHNLRAATADLPDDIEVLAFVDSDARPRADWLRRLVARLDRSEIGAVTGYRWFVPTRLSAAQLLLYSINSSVASGVGPGGHHLVWGGSWAIRRDVFERLELREAWRQTLSDDLVATRVLRGAGLRVDFEPACMVASPIDGGWRQTFSFVRRQYVIARFYAPRWWLLALAAATLGVVTFWGGLGITAVAASQGSHGAWLPASVCTLFYACTVLRGCQRRALMRIYLPERQPRLEAAAWVELWMGPLVGLAHWLSIVSSLAGSELQWRGVRYRIDRGGHIEIVARAAHAMPPPPIERSAAPRLQAVHCHTGGS
ncbi:MAG TPA: glycosyltransferase [Pirellulales bacterium]|nr:glycosyltransferase [Pirellulales bacterium]